MNLIQLNVGDIAQCVLRTEVFWMGKSIPFIMPLKSYVRISLVIGIRVDISS